MQIAEICIITSLSLFIFSSFISNFPNREAMTKLWKVKKNKWGPKMNTDILSVMLILRFGGKQNMNSFWRQSTGSKGHAEWRARCWSLIVGLALF